ncbi:MAG: type IV-A pilus assembly ATPase PilB, partial [Verrucomicrobiota bacterium]
PVGCDQCLQTGYKGRVGIHELMQTSEDLVRGINAGYETAVLKKIAIHNGMKTLHQDALLKVFEGLTSLEEAVATIPPDMEDLRAIMGAASLEELLGATAPLPS